MLADGVIEPSSSPWVSPIVVVPKKNGELRPCVDMRRVNEVTKAIRYPLGHIQDILDSVAPSGGTLRYYSTLDLKSSYWQVPMADEASKERTAFATPSAQYQYPFWRTLYRVAPPGVQHSPRHGGGVQWST